MVRFKHSLLALLLAFCIGHIQAQTTPTPDLHLFVKDHLTLSIGMMLREPAKTSPRNGFSTNDPHYGGAWAPGARLGFTYTLNLSKNFGFESGFVAALYRQQTKLIFPNEPRLGGLNWFSNTAIEVPFRFFYRAKIAKKLWIHPFVGLSMQSYGRNGTSSGFTFLGDGNKPVYYGNVLIEVSEDQSIFWAGNLGFSLSKRIACEDLIRITFSTNLLLDGKNFLTSTGRYEIYDGDNTLIGYGLVNTRGNMLAVDIGYTFSRTRELRRDLGLISPIE